MSPGQTIAAAALLATWEAGLSTGGVSRALLLHSVARPQAGTEELLAVPVGSRDADLYALRGALFGDRLNVRVTCQECIEEMEFDFSVRDAVGAATAADTPLVVAVDGWTVRFRLPTTGDLAAVEKAAPERAGAELIGRCVLEVTRVGGARAGGARVDDTRVDNTRVGGTGPGGTQEGGGFAADELPEHVRRAVADAAAEADPYADVTLNVACPACGHRAAADLDIASYLWTELDAWARGTLLDVHLLAAAYGWSEAEILALSPLRRRYYLELCADA